MEYQVKALRQLTENTSQHTPQLVSILHTTQSDDGMVPTAWESGLVQVILLERVRMNKPKYRKPLKMHLSK
jgi:hypothetical protein